MRGGRRTQAASRSCGCPTICSETRRSLRSRQPSSSSSWSRRSDHAIRRANLPSATWRKSSYSNSDGGNCVEVADGLPGLVPVRDSKRPERPAVIFGASAWSPRERGSQTC
ncbi:DUF397 domain-containing protein [Streptomyces cyaneofuscatus]|uniref:DUF397 domain-containing protein n=1 Tax=Streptomyces cyaneofuscatus TaxID=66883 RepID=UPI0036E9890A